MSRKATYSNEIKLEIVKRYLNGESAITLANEYGMAKTSDRRIRKWASKYQIYGENSFETNNKNKAYSKELKIKVINDYLYGGYSLIDLANLYDISSDEIVRQWVIKYNSGIEIKDYDPKSEVYTMKARKTTFEERLDIVKYVLANNNDYKGAADKFSVPYASVYQWVSKYNKYGENSLLDKRGRPSTAEPVKVLTTEEKQALEIEKLKRELERKDMVIEVLKKNIEIQEQIERNSRLFAKKTNMKR